MKLIYPKKFMVQACVALFVVSMGYFLKIFWANVAILLVLFIWCVYSNKELAETVFETIVRKIKKDEE